MIGEKKAEVLDAEWAHFLAERRLLLEASYEAVLRLEEDPFFAFSPNDSLDNTFIAPLALEVIDKLRNHTARAV